MPALPRVSVAAAAVGLAVLSACGTSGRSLDSAVADPLHDRVDAVREALADGKQSDARGALSAFRTDVRRLVDDSALQPQDAQVLLTQAERIAAAIPKADSSSTVPDVRPVPVPETRPDVDDSVGNQGNGKGSKKAQDDEAEAEETDPVPRETVPEPDPDPVTPDDPAPDDGAPGGTPDDSTPDDDAPDPAPEDPTPEDPAPDDGLPDDGEPDPADPGTDGGTAP